MAVPIPTGVDFVSARLRGRLSRLAALARLDELCRLHTIPDLARALVGEAAFRTAAELERRLIADLARELSQVARWLDGPAGSFAQWLAARYFVENLKVLARGFATGAPEADILAHLAPTPDQPALDVKALLHAESVEAFADATASKPLRLAVRQAAEVYHANPHAFFIESALDRGYFLELLARLNAMTDEDRAGSAELVFQEIDLFHVMLVARGKFQYGLKAELLAPFHVRGTRVPEDRMAAMLAAPDVTTAAARALGTMVDLLPPGDVDAVAMEVLAWHRYLRLAMGALQRGQLAAGIVAAYAALRRVELANLITVSEGIAAGLEPDAIRRRLIPRPDLAAWLKTAAEAARV
jgi:vacuolar-type H+-ATPase subunit C/Vma6